MDKQRGNRSDKRNTGFRWLTMLVLVACVASLPALMANAAPVHDKAAVSAMPAAKTYTLSPQEQLAVNLLNQARQNEGLQPLQVLPRTCVPANFSLMSIRTAKILSIGWRRSASIFPMPARTSLSARMWKQQTGCCWRVRCIGKTSSTPNSLRSVSASGRTRAAEYTWCRSSSDRSNFSLDKSNLWAII